jgi:D-3-phosphoglycerate dehydrogenase
LPFVTDRPAIVTVGPLADPAPAILSRFGSIAVAPEDSEAGLVPLLGGAVALVAGGATPVSARLLEAAPRLRVVGRNGVGVDEIDLPAATARGIPVVITPGTNDLAVAEGAIAMLLALVKRLPSLDRMVRAGAWDERVDVRPGDVAGSTLAVIGFGRTGRRTAELARGLGMRVVAYDPVVDVRDAGAEPVGLDEAFAQAEHVCLHVPLTEATRGLISAERLAAAKPGLTLVNVSRGAVAPLDELLAALEAGRLGGVGLDVFDPEPPDPSHPIFAREDVLCSPHALVQTPRTVEAVYDAMSRGMAAVLDGGRAEHVANPEVWS